MTTEPVTRKPDSREPDSAVCETRNLYPAYCHAVSCDAAGCVSDWIDEFMEKYRKDNPDFEVQKP